MHRSTGSPRVSHSENEPVTWTVIVLGLTTRGSRGTPDNAVALGAGFSEGTGAGVILLGHVNSLISPRNLHLLSKKNRREENLLVLRDETLVQRKDKEYDKDVAQ